MNYGKTSWDDLKKRRNINVEKWAEKYQPQSFEHLNEILYKMSVRPLRYDHEDIFLLLSHSLFQKHADKVVTFAKRKLGDDILSVELTKEETINVDDIIDYKTDKKLEVKEFNKFLSNSGLKQNATQSEVEKEIDDELDILEGDYQNEDDE